MPWSNTYLLGGITMLCLLMACQRVQQPETKNLRVNSPFEMIGHLQASDDPFALYGQAYPSFRFITQARLIQTEIDDGASQEVVAQTTVEKLGEDYFHILRQPLDPTPSVELIYDHGLLYLRPHLEKTFYQIKNNPQVEYLKQTILTEIFTYFEANQFAQTTPTPQDQNNCYQQGPQMICFDAQTLLPTHGSFTQLLASPTKERDKLASKLEISFRLEIGPDNITPIHPTKVHSLRSH